MNKSEALQEVRKRLGNAVIDEIHAFNELTLEVERDHIIEVLTILKETPNPGYEVLIDLTAVDYLEPIVQTKVVYLLQNPVNFERLRIATWIKRGEKLPSITRLWEGADWYERELYDLFGIHFEGHPDMKRILMPNDWIGHPLQKDFPLMEEPVQFKHGVKPKPPSEIIPYDKTDRKRV